MADVVWADLSSKERGLGVVCISLEPAWPASMTAAERDVVGLLIRGASYREIADERGCAVSTVANQVASVLKKTSTRSASELLAGLAAGTGFGAGDHHDG